MIAVDTNILVLAHRRDGPWHERAKECMRGLAEGTARWAIPWPCVHEFFSTVTHPRIFQPPSTCEEAVAQIDAWLGSPSLVLLHEGGGYWARLRSLVETARIVGPKVHDARIAAICLLHRVRELWSADRDFGRFPELRTRNPLL